MSYSRGDVESPDEVIACLKARGSFPAFWVSFFLIAYVSSFVLSGTRIPSLNIDFSWMSVLEYAAEFKFQFGRDIVFTFGPLGYLYADASQGYLVSQRIIFALAWAGMVAWTATGVAQKVAGPSRYLFIAWFLLFSNTGESDTGKLEQQVFLVMAYGSLIMLEYLRERKVATAIFLGAFALLALIKVTFLMAAVVSIVVCAAVQFAKGDMKAAAAIPAIFVAVFLAVWLATSQQLSSLFPWLKGGFELAGGYSEAMTIEPKLWVFRLCVTAGALFLVALIVRARGNHVSMSAAGFLLITALYTFLSWKQGLVRADKHVFAFILFLPLAFALLMIEPARNAISGKARLGLRTLFVGAIVLCILAANTQEAGTMWQRVLTWPNRVLQNAGLIMKSMTGQGKACYEAFQASPRQDPRLYLPIARSLINGSSVDVINYRQYAVLGNNLNYRPRPVFQGYSTYTPYLQSLNLAFFQSNQRPQYVLFNMESIDNRFATLDDAMLLPFLFRNYKPVAQDGNFLILQATGDRPTDVRLRLIDERTIGFDEVLNLAHMRGISLIMQVDMNSTVWGKLTKLVFQAPSVSLNIHEGEKTVSKRFIPAMAKGGFLFTPPLGNNHDVISMYEGVGGQIERVSFSRPADAWWQLSDEITVRLYSME
jgi:hypothetical protein